MTKARRRTAKKLVLPLIAVGMMTAMMAMHSSSSGHTKANVVNALYSR